MENAKVLFVTFEANDVMTTSSLYGSLGFLRNTLPLDTFNDGTDTRYFEGIGVLGGDDADYYKLNFCWTADGYYWFDFDYQSVGSRPTPQPGDVIMDSSTPKTAQSLFDWLDARGLIKEAE